ncbi:uncharacterized protein LOC144123752 [Amblyomma americanum]
MENQQPVANGPQHHHAASAPVSTPPVALHQHVTSLPSRVSVGSTAGTSGYMRSPIRGDEWGIPESYQQDTLSPTVSTPVPSPQPTPQPPLKPTPATRLQPSPRATPNPLGKRRRDDEAMRDVAAAVQASNGQQELLIQNVNILTLIL